MAHTKSTAGAYSILGEEEVNALISYTIYVECRVLMAMMWRSAIRLYDVCCSLFERQKDFRQVDVCDER